MSAEDRDLWVYLLHFKSDRDRNRRCLNVLN